MTTLSICPISTASTLTVGGCQEYQVDASSSSFTITLPDATAGDGQYLIFKRQDNTVHTVTISTQSSQTIDGAGTLSLGQKGHHELISYNGNWFITG